MLQDNLPTHTDNQSGRWQTDIFGKDDGTEMAATIMFFTDAGNLSGGKVCSAQTLVNAMAARHTFCTHARTHTRARTHTHTLLYL